MNISLTPELESFITQKVRGGFYHSSSEVVREALRLLADQDALKKQRIESLNRDIDIGLRQIHRGETVTGEELRTELMAMRGERNEGSAN